MKNQTTYIPSKAQKHSSLLYNKLALIFIFALVLLSNSSHGQVNFKWGFDVDEAYINDYVEIKADNYFIVGSKNKEQSTSTNPKQDSAWVVKWSLEGDSISRMYKPEGFDQCSYNKLISKKDGGLIVLGSLQFDNIEDSSGFIVVGYDSSLNIQWENHLVLPRVNVTPVSSIKLPNDNWVIALDTRNYNWNGSPINQGFLIELTESGQILKVVADTMSHFQQVLMHPDSTRFYVFGHYLQIPGYPNYIGSVMEYDLELNKLAQKPIYASDVLDKLYHCIWLDGDTLLMAAGQTTNNYYSYDLCLFKMLDGDSIIAIDETCFHYPNIDCAQPGGCISITTDSNIIRVGNVGGALIEKAFISKYDMNFNLLYHWIIDEEEYRYSTYNPMATCDSGYLVSIYRAEYGGFTGDSTFIIKFGKDGPVADIDEFKAFRKTNHMLYPNPGNDQVYVELSIDYDISKPIYIEFYTENGAKEFCTHINSRGETIKTNTLKQGMYIYRIVNNGTILGSGKWLKN